MDNKYQVLLENLMDGFAYCKLLVNNQGRPVDYVFLEVNQAFLKMFDISKNSVINKCVTEVFSGIDNSTFGLLEFYEEVAIKGKSIGIQKFSKTLNKWYQISAYSIERGYFATTYQDITELKKAEEEQCRFFNLANDMFAIISFGGYFLEVSPAWEKILGYSRDEIIDKHISEFIHPEDLEKTLQVVKERFSGGSPITNFRNRYISKTGNYRWLSWNSSILPSEGLIYATIRDITAIKYYEDKLSQSEESYRALVEASPYGIVVVENNIIQYVNKATVLISAADSDTALLEKSIFDFLPKEYHRLINRRIKNILINPNKKNIAGELTLVNLEGVFIDFEVTGIKVPYKKTTALMLIIRDISSRKQTEELKQYLEEKKKSLDKVIECDRIKTDFFSNISHEFKTPLNVILGTLQLLNLYLQHDIVQVDTKLQKKFDIMKQNCYRLLRLVNNVIDITRIDAGYYEIQLANYDIVAIIKAISYSVKEYIEGKGLILDFYSNTTSKIIACDPDKMERIFLNLISNAIKFTKPGGKIEVAISAGINCIEVSVKDNGIGIPTEKQEAIFDRFMQLDKSLTKSYEGSGIGLSLVESLVKMHNGRINVKSQEGIGSEFIVELPYVTIPDEIMAVGEVAATFDCPVERINIEFSDIYIK